VSPKSADTASLVEDITEILATQTGRSPREIDARSTLIEDLDLDSVDFLALVAALRERYGIRPDIAWVIRRMRQTTLATVGDLVGFIREILAASDPAARGEG